MESKNRRECPVCESYIDNDDICAKCEEDYTWSTGIKQSRASKEEKLNIKWKEKPNDHNCGVRDSD